mmetsp:Transcript_30753/g.40623  ORF Transcript_30753/g.40623 Transcript_30753/m.40623 type:complete len:319 (+) Transcript_30753:176-1132(+)
MMYSLEEINKILRAPQAFETRKEKLMSCLEEFLVANIDPKKSPNLSSGVDDLTLVFDVLGSEVFRRSDLLVPLLKVMKILMRKPENRASVLDAQMANLVLVLSAPPSMVAAREAANVILNMCYDSQNVVMFVQQGGARALVPLTQSPDINLQGSALGALQSVSYQKEGRSALREIGAISLVCSLLESEHQKVQARAVGAVHNLSADAQNLHHIREAGGLEALVPLLRSHESEVCSLAAGALQNLSRERASRKVLYACGAVAPLTDLLVGADIHSQASAAGALLNILGPELDDSKKEAFGVFLADSIVMGTIVSCFTSR